MCASGWIAARIDLAGQHCPRRPPTFTMDDMDAIVSSILPLVAIVATGFFARRFNVVEANLRKPLIDYCLYFGIPALVFQTIVAGDLPERPPYVVWAAYLIPAAGCWIVASLIASAGRGDAAPSSASMALAATYGNVLMLGIPVTLLHFRAEASSTVAMIALVHSPVLFAAAAVQSGIFPANRKVVAAAEGPFVAPRRRLVFVRFTELGRDLLSNPIIIAIALSMLFKTGGITIPPLLGRVLSILGQGTLPCVLIGIGIGLAGYAKRADDGALVAIVTLKLAALPILAWWVGTYVLQLDPMTLAVVTFLCAMPVGANALAFAESNGEASDSISAAIAISTVLSPITLSIALWALGSY